MHNDLKPFIIPVFLPHAGCPHQCVFCNQKAITGASGGTSLDVARAEILKYLSYPRKNRSQTTVSFYGGNFLGLPHSIIKRLLSLAAEFVDQGLVDGIRFSTRPDTVDDRTLDLLKPFPVTTVELGVQSLDDEVLEQSRRGHRASDSLAAARLVQERGYSLGLQMMTGLPGDTGGQSVQTAQGIVALQPNFVRIYPTVILEGSPLAHLWRQGRYKASSLEEAVALAKNLLTVFNQADIPVVRLGLAASDSLDSEGTILAGPYHPAFGHLVASAIFLDKALGLLKQHGITSGPVTFQVHPKSLSSLRGQKNTNMRHLEKLLDSAPVIHQDASLPRDHLSLLSRS